MALMSWRVLERLPLVNEVENIRSLVVSKCSKIK